MSRKKLTSALLSPFARAVHVLRPLGRAWAHARLCAAVAYPVPESVVVLSAPEVHGTGHIRLGRDLYLYRELYLETQGGGEISIGDEVVISRGTHIVAFGRITIGNGTMIGEYCSLRDANHKFGEGVSIRHSGHESKPIAIGERVWIGRGVTVLAGVTIGDGSVIGANAVVTRDVPAGPVVAGIPARPLMRAPAKEE